MYEKSPSSTKSDTICYLSISQLAKNFVNLLKVVTVANSDTCQCQNVLKLDWAFIYAKVNYPNF